jgi:hypothetical protein
VIITLHSASCNASEKLILASRKTIFYKIRDYWDLVQAQQQKVAHQKSLFKNNYFDIQTFFLGGLLRSWPHCGFLSRDPHRIVFEGLAPAL